MLHSFLEGRSRIITHITAWTLVAVLIFLGISGFSDTTEALARTVTNMFFLVGQFYLNARIFINQFFEKRRYGLLFLSSMLLIIISAVLRTWVEIDIFGASIFVGGVGEKVSVFKMFSAYLITFLLLVLFSTMYQLVENRNKLALQHSLLEARHHEAQLNFLKAQINPHFLFNSLNNIYAAATVRHPRTPDMVLRLSDLLRYVTYEGQHDKVSLAREIAQIKGYIDLLQLKSPDPLPITLTIEGTVDAIYLAPLLLLPLVENACKHSNIEDEMAMDPFIHINIHAFSGEQLLFRTMNTFDPANSQKDSVGGVGLANVQQRLELHYPGNSHLVAQSAQNHFEVSLHIQFPLHT